MSKTLELCRCCNRLSVVTEAGVCADCLTSQEDKYHSVKDYLYENKGATINMVSDACDVSKRSIIRWLREERIEVLESSRIKPHCLRCNAEILSGCYCYECKKVVGNITNNTAVAKNSGKNSKRGFGKSTRENDKMRFF